MMTDKTRRTLAVDGSQKGKVTQSKEASKFSSKLRQFLADVESLRHDYGGLEQYEELLIVRSHLQKELAQHTLIGPFARCPVP